MQNKALLAQIGFFVVILLNFHLKILHVSRQHQTTATVRSIESPTGFEVDGRWAGRGLADHNSSTARPASVQPPSSQCPAHVHLTGDQEASHSHAKWLIILNCLIMLISNTLDRWQQIYFSDGAVPV